MKHIKTSPLWPVACAMALLTPLPALADTVMVTNEQDSGAGSLRQALLTARPLDNIRFAPNVKVISLTSGALNITKNAYILGSDSNKITINGNQNGRVFKISGADEVTLSNLIIADGKDTNLGGGIYSDAGVLILNKCVVRNNGVTLNELRPSTGLQDFTLAAGAGIYSNGTLSLFDTEVRDNKAWITSKKPVWVFGAGVYSQDKFIATNSTFANNDAYGAASAGNARVYGGGIFANEGFELTNSTVSNNTTMAQCRFNSQPNADYCNSTGAGIFANHNTFGTKLSYNTFYKNATYNNSANATNAAAGVAIKQNALTMNGNIISGGNHGDCQLGSAVQFSGLNNWVQDGSCSATFTGDPKLAPLQVFGGFTPSHPPYFNSGVLDAIPADQCQNKLDQRRTRRPQVAGCDVGSVELTAEQRVDNTATRTGPINPSDAVQ